ncbi:MAG: molybdenum cofactor biosynthesis protein MoaE [Phycisphaerales bacterium]|nr:molybdenum cofactor biosynthesis protein MoaE [Phycisphaerales bacterium]
MSTTIRVTALFLGPARDFAGEESATFELSPGATVATIRAAILEKFPRIRSAMGSIRIAVNQEFAGNEHPLRNGDEIALIPPVSGGGGSDPIWVELFDGPLPADRIREFISGHPALGGIVAFEGTTRSEIDRRHGRLIRLDYEAYASMALCRMRSLAETARERWSAGRVAITHRLGPVPTGESSVMIVVACPHRAEAFDACRWLIDMLKRDVPLWKKDVFEDGFVRWVEPIRYDCSRPPNQQSEPRP